MYYLFLLFPKWNIARCASVCLNVYVYVRVRASVIVGWFEQGASTRVLRDCWVCYKGVSDHIYI